MNSLCLTPETVLAKLSPRTKAVMVVHYGGYAVDVETLRRALPPGVAIIEDAAHALGARYPDGTAVGSSGNLVCFSFYANKNLSTAEGGAIAVRDNEIADHLRSLRQHALPIDAWKRFTHSKSILLSGALSELGYKMNFTDLQAAIGRVQLARQGEFAAIRHSIAIEFVHGLSKCSPPVRFQSENDGPRHARHLFVVQLPTESMRKSRDAVLIALRALNIGASIHYAPLHLMPLYTGGFQPENLPVAEVVARSLITLPISAAMTVDDAKEVVDALRSTIE